MAYRKLNSDYTKNRLEICDIMAEALKEDFDINAGEKEISEYINLLLVDYALLPKSVLNVFTIDEPYQEGAGHEND